MTHLGRFLEIISYERNFHTSFINIDRSKNDDLEVKIWMERRGKEKREEGKSENGEDGFASKEEKFSREIK